jgi:hypothetical protein
MGGRAMRLMSGRGVGECGIGRHSYGGGVISEVGWLSFCGAPPRGFCLAPRNLVVWVGESGSGRLFPTGGNSSLIYLKHGLDASPAPPPGQHRGL